MSSLLPIIGVDIDNVIADTDSMIRELILNYFGVSSVREQIVTWNYHNNLLISKEQEQFIFDQFHRYYCGEVNLIPDSKEVLSQLINNLDVWIITQRPPCTERLTEMWLTKMQVPFTKLIFAKKKVLHANSMIFFVEDNKEAAFSIAQLGITTFLMDCPWNRDIDHSPNIIRIKGWKEILEKILQHRLNVGNFHLQFA